MLQQTTYSVTLGIGLIFVYCITLHYKLFLYADFANSVHKYNQITHLQYFFGCNWMNVGIKSIATWYFYLLLSKYNYFYILECFVA